MSGTKAGLLGVALLGAAAAQAASNEEFFLKVPGINGESQSQAYKVRASETLGKDTLTIYERA